MLRIAHLSRVALLGVTASACATAPVSTTPPAPRFYHAFSYGSEAEFNPLTEILNEGFDVLRTSSQDRHVFRRDYGTGAENVWRSVTHPDATFRFYGYRNALRNEWLPLTPTGHHGGGAWVPNYEYHLLGSGMISVRMEEWYRDHDVPHPFAASFATLMTAHYLNEIVENGTSRLPNEDATTDLLLFDLGGVALWRFDAVQRLFSGPLELTNWAAQPSLDVPSQTLENTGQEFVLRARLPGAKKWRLMYYFGMSSLLGTSRLLSNGDAISIAAGVDAVDNPVVDPRTGAKTATLRPKGALFYDRNGSLLWSVQVGSRSDVAVFDANLYPGLLRVGGVSPGFWLQSPRSGGLRIGLVSRLGIGVGHGPEK